MLNGVMEVLERRRSPSMADKGMIVAVVSWILLVVMIFTILTRFAMKLAMSKKKNKFGSDDLFVGLAALFSIGQTAAVSMESMHALGQHIRELTPSQIQTFQKSEYASCMLYLANMGCARISICILIKKFLPGGVSKCSAMVFAIFSVLWTVSGLFASAFPCSTPHPWDRERKRCYNTVKFVNYIGVTNIIVEVLLVSIPLSVWNLRLTAGRRVSVSLTFIARLSIVIAVIAQLVFFNRYAHSDNYTHDFWPTVLCVQVAQNLSVITACIPCLHPFILSILSGETKPETLRFDCHQVCKAKRFMSMKSFKFDSTSSSEESTTPVKEKETDYCRPLATHGLDRSSAHLNAPHFNRFPSNVAMPLDGPTPPENFFNRIVEIPSRPPTSHSSTPQKEPAIPKTLSEVGVLPAVDWDTDSSDRSSERSSSSRRRPDSTYILNRQKVISVPEENAMYDEQYWRKYPPPPSGER